MMMMLWIEQTCVLHRHLLETAARYCSRHKTDSDMLGSPNGRQLDIYQEAGQRL